MQEFWIEEHAREEAERLARTIGAVLACGCASTISPDHDVQWSLTRPLDPMEIPF